MPKKIILSPSQLDALSCRLRHFWYKEGYSPVKPKSALELGKGVHEGLEGYYRTWEHPVEGFEAWVNRRMRELARNGRLWEIVKQDMMKLRELGVAMLDGYYEKYHDTELFEVLAVEHEITRRIPAPSYIPRNLRVFPSGVRFYAKARIDTVVRDVRLDKVFVLEHKTFTRFYEDSLHRDHQFVIEKFVAEGWLREPVAGVIYNGLRKMKPGPRVKLPLFQRRYLYIHPHQVKVMLERVYWNCVALLSPDFRVYPEPSTMVCAWCSYKEPCTAYMKGEDYEFILENLFTKRSHS